MQIENETIQETSEKVSPKTLGQTIRELAIFAAIAVIIVIPIRIFIAQPFIVSGSSMIPTFENADYLIIDEISYRLGDPKRLDVIIFRYPRNPSKFFIKRIIGLPGETIDINGNSVTITSTEYKDGFKLEQPFVKNPGDDKLHVELKDDEYFVMGDNRRASSDSRYWGPVKKELVVGRAFLRLLPISHMDILPGDLK